MTENLLCAYCLIEQRMEMPAVTLLDGTALCASHAPEIAEQQEAADNEKQRLVNEAKARLHRFDPRK